MYTQAEVVRTINDLRTCPFSGLEVSRLVVNDEYKYDSALKDDNPAVN